MKNTELLSAVIWHLECMVVALERVKNFTPPADSFQMRMHYSLYITNLMSIVEMLKEMHNNSFEKNLIKALKFQDVPGDQVLDYVRELRNGIVHRGIDPTSGVTVLNGINCAVAPVQIQNRSGSTTYKAPFLLLRDLFCHLEVHSKPVFANYLKQNIEQMELHNPQALLDDTLGAMEAVPHMPNWAKHMARQNLTTEMLLDTQKNQIQKLKQLLKPIAIVSSS